MMGGGIRGDRKSYASGRDDEAADAYEASRGTTLDNYSTKPRVFISFHVEDEAMIKLLRDQAKNSDKLEFTDYSVKEPFDEKWKTQCTERLKQSSVLVCAIGDDTHSREAVLWEINKAYELGKPVFGVRLHSDKNHKIPQPMIDRRAKIIPWKLDAIQAELDNLP
jgi:DNA-directed RNA polymerase subunit L